MSFSIKDNFLLRANADITRVLSLALREKVQDERLVDFNILRCECSADLSSCRVYVDGGETEFAHLSAFFKNEIAHNIKIRRIPNLRFILDDGDKNVQRVEELLAQIHGGAK